MDTTPDFDDITAALERLGSDVTAPECHGTLCGLLCARGTLAPADWLALVFPDIDPSDLLGREATAVLERLHAVTVRQLADPALGFQPLLPLEAARLAERTEALGDWCQGFLIGLSRDGAHDLARLPEASLEIVRDLVNIARITEYEQTGAEEDESALAEIIEYVRMGVLLVNEELNPVRVPMRNDSTLH